MEEEDDSDAEVPSQAHPNPVPYSALTKLQTGPNSLIVGVSGEGIVPISKQMPTLANFLQDSQNTINIGLEMAKKLQENAPHGAPPPVLDKAWVEEMLSFLMTKKAKEFFHKNYLSTLRNVLKKSLEDKDKKQPTFQEFLEVLQKMNIGMQGEDVQRTVENPLGDYNAANLKEASLEKLCRLYHGLESHEMKQALTAIQITKHKCDVLESMSEQYKEDHGTEEGFQKYLSDKKIRQSSSFYEYRALSKVFKKFKNLQTFKISITFYRNNKEHFKALMAMADPPGWLLKEG